MTRDDGARFGPADLASPNVSTYDAARALGLTPSGVRHLIATDQLRCRRLPSGRREIPRVAVLALVDRRARLALVLELVTRPPARPLPARAPQQLKLFHVRRRRQAKAALDVRTAKVRRIA